MQRGKRERSLFLEYSPSFAMLLKGNGTGKSNFLFVLGLMLSPSVSYLTPDQAQPGSKVSKQAFTLYSQTEGQNYKAWANASGFPLILSAVPCCRPVSSLFLLRVHALGEEQLVAWLFREYLQSKPAREDTSLLAICGQDSGLFSMLFSIKTTNSFSSRSLASFPATRPPARASPRGCSTLRTLQSMRTWRLCWRPPPSAGKAPPRSGFALEAGPAEVSASSFLLATFLVAR